MLCLRTVLSHSRVLSETQITGCRYVSSAHIRYVQQILQQNEHSRQLNAPTLMWYYFLYLDPQNILLFILQSSLFLAMTRIKLVRITQLRTTGLRDESVLGIQLSAFVPKVVEPFFPLLVIRTPRPMIRLTCSAYSTATEVPPVPHMQVNAYSTILLPMRSAARTRMLGRRSKSFITHPRRKARSSRSF